MTETTNEKRQSDKWSQSAQDLDIFINKELERSIGDYLQWMKSEGYAHSTWLGYEQVLNNFLNYVSSRKIAWDNIFTLDTLNEFIKQRKNAWESAAIRGLCRYLFAKKRIGCAIGRKKDPCLPKIYQEYLSYYAQSRQVSRPQIGAVKRVLGALHEYLNRANIVLAAIKIQHIDAFLSEFCASHAPGTRSLHRSYLRGFLTYLYQHRGILSKNLAPLVVGPPIFAPQKPPMFLRPHEVKQLLDSLTISTDKDLRIYAMVHLAYFLGLRPHEISLITLDDISFTKAELTLKNRKNNRQVQLPLPENVLKAITAYIVGARPKNKHRTLFLSLITPHAPICAGVVGHYLTGCLHSAGISATAYWLRHTYAQNLLEAGASIYEIKEMLGHDRIDSTRKYLSIHIQLMRKVLFDETL